MLPDLTDLTGLEAWTNYIKGLVSYSGNPDIINGFDWTSASALTVGGYLNLIDFAEAALTSFNWSFLTAQIPFIENLLVSQGLPAATISVALGFLRDFASGDISIITDGFDFIREQLAGFAPETLLLDALSGEGGGGGLPTNGPDVLEGTSGPDMIPGKGGDDDLSGVGGNDTLKGGGGNDTLKGGNGNDLLFGDEGRDVIKGGAGKDAISGGGGNDRISGDGGNDLLRGGAGRDAFLFGKGDGKDVVTDFRDDVDTLVLDDALWRGTLTARQVIDKFGDQVGDDFVLTFRKDSITLRNFEGEDLRNDLDIV